jgi:ketosteroid isomerase-like protein
MAENVEVARRLLEAWNAGDLQTVLALMHPDVKIDYSAGAPGLAESYTGHDGIRRYWRDLRGPWTSLTIDPEEMRESGDNVVTVFTFEGHGREGIVVRRRLANVVTVIGGLVTRLDAYGDPSAALEAAGLSE